MKHILLIAGGWSSEREVSLTGGKGIEKAIKRLGHKVTLYDPQYSFDDLPSALNGKDFAFINLHGSPGEDGLVQALLERLNMPYQGSGPAASLLALDKAAAKGLFHNAGLRVAPSILLSRKPTKTWAPPFSFPVFVKANTSGSSLNLACAYTHKELHDILDAFSKIGGTYLLEKAVEGIEVTCGVLAELENGKETPKALPPILIKANNDTGLFDYSSKYSPGGAIELCPAPIPEDLTRKIQEISVAAHQLLGLCGYSRSDFMVPADGEPVLLEVNTLPGMTPTSLVPQEAEAIGLGFDGLIARLIELGEAAHQRRKLE